MRAYVIRLIALMSALTAGLTACNALFGDGDGERREIGVIDAGTSTDALVMPDTVQAGVPFAITVTTFGSCLRPDGVDIHVAGATADITPYDITLGSGVVCPAILVDFPRSVTLSFDTPGTATVRLHGRSFSPGAGTVTVEEAAVVAP